MGGHDKTGCFVKSFALVFFSELDDVQYQIIHLFFYFLMFAETSPMHRLARQAMDPNKMLHPSSTSQLKVSKSPCLIKITTSPAANPNSRYLIHLVGLEIHH